MRRIPVGAVVAATAVLVGCHSITEELPTEPTEATQAASAAAPAAAPAAGVLTVAIPALTAGVASTPTPTPTSTPAPAPPSGTTPAPAATPAPAPPPPAPTPEPAPAPTGGGGSADGCGSPLPPAVSKVKAKVHIKGGNKYTLDATPLVGGREYCKEIGFTDGRVRCPVRQEGHPERHACEAYAVGNAEDTGRTGPTWTRNSSYCKGNACKNHPDNQYLLWAYKSGYYEACVKGGTCGSVDVSR